MNNIKRFLIYFKRLGLKKTMDRIYKKIGLKKEIDYLEKRYDEWKEMPESEYPRMLKEWYKENTGRDLNLENPITFNEKLQWLKLYDSSNIKTLLADKYEMRNWIKDKIGEKYLIPLLGVWDTFDDINFDELPNAFALKANHGSGWNVIVKDKSILDISEAREKFDKWMKTNFAFVGGLELHYKRIVPKIIAEKYIENINGLIDYRFYCFNGIPEQVWVDIYSGTPNHKRDIYDMNWDKINIKCTWPSGGNLLSQKPQNFELMKQFAKILSDGFKFVRVDFFEVDNQLFMGEMTFIPMSGLGKFEPEEWDYILGEKIKL